MRRNLIEKIVLTVVLLAWYVLMPQQGYVWDEEGVQHLSYMLCHANVWHLAGNLFVLWCLKDKLYLPSGVCIAYLASFIPVIGSVWDGFSFSGETMGFSGAIFAICGTKWGYFILREQNKEKRDKAMRDFFLKVIPFILLGAFIPNINWSLHLYCMMAGFIYGRCRR